jgi:preprotein translocase subunit SecF
MEVVAMFKLKGKQIGFVKNRKKFFIFSTVLMLVIIVSSFVFGVDLDIRFKGGTMVDYSYEGETGAVDLEQVKDLASDILGTNVSVEEKFNKLTEKNGFEITLLDNDSVSSELQGQLNDTLTETFSEQNIKQLSITSVNPTMGKEFFIKCLVAVVFGSLLMIVYIGIRFKKIGGVSAGFMAVVALLHDVMVVFGTFVIFKMPLDDSFIAVILTILGYSINSTIVIYDRIRENKRLYGATKSLAEVVNISVNQTLARSVNTSVATILSMVVVCVVALVCGVTSILSFAFPIIMGLISGAYSSVCLASELWVTWKERKKSKA